MKKIWVLLLAVALTTTLSACGKQPVAEIDATKAAMDAATAEGAEKYAADDLKAVNDSMAVAMEEIKVQDGKMFKNYDKAKEMLTKVKADADALKTKTVTVREEQRGNALTALADATASVVEAQGLLENAPVGKGSMADLEAMRADVAGLQASIEEIQPIIDGGDFLVAQEKADAIRSKAVAVSDEVRKAQMKMAALKKK